MTTSRRTFLKQSSAALAGVAVFSHPLLKNVKAAGVTGLQLYSVRDDMRKDPGGTLKALSTMGYKYVEHANYVDRKFYGYPAAEFKKLLDGLGLVMPSGHTVLNSSHWDAATNDFNDKWKYTVEDAAVLGQKY